MGSAAVVQDSILDALELGYVVLVYLGVCSLVAEGSYHFIDSVMQPQDVCVRLEVLPIISVDKDKDMSIWFPTVHFKGE